MSESMTYKYISDQKWTELNLKFLSDYSNAKVYIIVIIIIITVMITRSSGGKL